MCQVTEDEDSTVKEIDVRTLVPAQSTQRSFELVGELSPGTSFVLVNDLDHKPLYYPLEADIRSNSYGSISRRARPYGGSRSESC